MCELARAGKGAAITRWPWITLLLFALAAISPLGQEAGYSALYAGEGLARNMGQIILIIYGGILLGLVALETLIRQLIYFRRRKRAPHTDGVSGG